MTDQELNNAIAEKMGWECRNLEGTPSIFGTWWKRPGSQSFNMKSCPDYLADAAASAELEDWLQRTIFADVEMEMLEGRTHAKVFLRHGLKPPVRCTVVYDDQTSPSAARRKALALCAYDALYQKETVKK